MTEFQGRIIIDSLGQNLQSIFIENIEEDTDGMTHNSKRRNYEQYTQALHNQT